jgi:hypothetical protein
MKFVEIKNFLSSTPSKKARSYTTLAVRDRVKFSYTFIGRGGEEEGGVEVLIVFILYSQKTTS